MNNLRRYILTLLLVLSTVLLSSCACRQMHTAGDALCVSVPAETLWTATDIHLQRGDIVKIQASGQWCHGNEDTSFFRPFYGPEGYDKKDEFVIMPKHNVGALIARTDDADPVFIGRSATFKVTDPGQLQLTMNEIPGPTAHKNNQGSLDVTITVYNQRSRDDL